MTEGYLRGWGLSGATVDLELGTAIFGRRADVNRWNDACRLQIETKFGDECEAIDIHGLTYYADAPSSFRRCESGFGDDIMM